LTPVSAHTETNLEILEGGRHLITEKPIARHPSQKADADDCCGRVRGGVLVVAATAMDDRSAACVAARQLVRDRRNRPRFAFCTLAVVAPQGLLRWIGPPTPPGSMNGVAGALRDMGRPTASRR